LKEVTTGTELLVLLGLNSFDGKKGIFPSQTKLANKCRLSRRVVSRTICDLRRKGLLTTTGHGKALTYRLLPPRLSPETCAPRAQEVSTRITPPAHDVLRDQKEPNELTKPTTNPIHHQHATQRAAKEAITQLDKAFTPIHKEIDREHSIRGLATRAGLAPGKAAVVAIEVGAAIANGITSDADRIRAAIANASKQQDAAASLAEVLRIVRSTNKVA
jgi:biotin operon repressor